MVLLALLYLVIWYLDFIHWNDDKRERAKGQPNERM